MRAIMTVAIILTLTSMAGCPGAATSQKNPFTTAAEAYGASMFGASDDDDMRSGGTTLDTDFRQLMSLTIANRHPEAELNVSFAAWVSPSNIRSGDQQDALLANGYYQLDEEVRIGSVHTLVPGTFVYGGSGMGGTTSLRLAPTRATTQDDTGDTGDDAADDTGDEDTTDEAVVNVSQSVERAFELITPDVILVFSHPPVSCDSVAFYFTVDGDPLTSEGISGTSNIFAGASSQASGLKTLAQIDVYECDPFMPGLFLRQGGGALSDNEYFEGQDVRFDFSPIPTVAGYFCQVLKTTP